MIARAGWMSDSKTVFAYVQNRTQTWLDFATWPAADAEAAACSSATTTKRLG